MPFDIYILSFKDILDILLVAFLLYKSYKLMKSSGSINIFIGILVFIIIWVIVSQVLQMRLLGSIFDKLVSVGVIALIVLFQDEIRHFLLSLGSRHRSNSLFRFLKGNKKKDTEKEDIMPIVMACLNMSKGKVGALIVIEKDFPLDDIVRTGDLIDANINQRAHLQKGVPVRFPVRHILLQRHVQVEHRDVRRARLDGLRPCRIPGQAVHGRVNLLVHLDEGQVGIRAEIERQADDA